ncbi:hypothetical protein N180_02885 [Pedobacter antarcticus 4BY]|uniref:DUF559 domain-containing protein n=2 Tax=Pedobacter antarcticus TaxID=34086 RepID=A0A081PKI7_9SPHI|nr:hypothetical protein [Pedobacter antarcticus]KEQ31210.1 hypothetical protein N180_02885 [Pedobacter antarcticus 4BY]SFE55051.1 hypothetical protein SAMN03003324_00864 [Pedobacter antarcticus]
MKSSAILKAVYKDCLDRGYILHGDLLLPPNHPDALKLLAVKPKKKKRVITRKTGWIDDERNIRNKANQRDAFMMFVEQQLHVEVWPEFYFSTERLYRFDYAIPILSNSTPLKLAIEQEGGIWAKGNSGHSSGTGISRDMEKSNLAQSQGWVVIRRTPDQMITSETIELIKSLIKQRIPL